MKLSNFIGGLEILRKYFEHDGYHIGAEHDVVCVYATDVTLSDEDVQKMVELGWFQRGGAISASESDSGVAGVYDPSEAWMAFV